MEGKLSRAAKKLESSPIQELSLLAQRCNAINLAEGFPDFPAPSHIKNAAVSAILDDFNQYRHVQGICDHLANKVNEMHGLDINPLTDIAICCGQTEAFAAAVFATIDQGDEVIVFDPSYETYETCIILAGGVPVHVPLDPPQWTLDPSKFLGSFTERTKAIVLNRAPVFERSKAVKKRLQFSNSPHNPTGKVFSKEELEVIAKACCSRNCLAITDEVYEHITYDDEKHISLASFSGMQERTIITSSLSKTFSVTGWRIGWAIAPTAIASAMRNIHIRITDSAPAPFQEAALTAFRSPPEYFETLRRDYESKRDYIIKLLAGVGFKIQFKPQGAFFLFAELPDNCALSDVEFVKKLIVEAGVVAVPGQGFFHTNSGVSNGNLNYHKRYIRFAFCKSDATLAAVAERFVSDSVSLKEVCVEQSSNTKYCHFGKALAHRAVYGYRSRNVRGNDARMSPSRLSKVSMASDHHHKTDHN
ncbi:kynurenine--oxoglutarate transaminase 1-like [Senna tora]|uniref:Kynurenine--oxoglutarate transaminase 1-like n=1 Tax=Senna tora TaxID=362788 RepID=A0A834SLN7_9FABA|nr:kynurenine--oxoglutarate transaminase 1-like [Senna tora]